MTVGPADPARIQLQASSEKADASSTCFSIVTLECTSPAKRFPPKTVNEQKFLSPQSLTFILNQEPIKLQDSTVETPIFLSSSPSFNIWRFRKIADALSFFLLF